LVRGGAMSESVPGARPAPGAAAMRWTWAASREAGPRSAAEEIARALRDGLGEGAVDLVLVFFTAPLARAAEEIRSALASALEPACLAGMSAAGVISAEHETEQGSAVVALGARLPGVRVAPFVLPPEIWSEPADDAGEFARRAPGAAEAEIAIVCADPHSLDAGALLAAFDRHAPGLRLVGGMASAGQRPGQNALFLNDWLSPTGGFGIALGGALRADVVVSQGCRPVGPPLAVTDSRRNIVVELDGRPATERLRQVLEAMSQEEQGLVRQGLLIGRPAARDASGRGDYLIRNVLGHDPESGALAVGDVVDQGERIRLHLRDAATAREDLELLLAPQAFDSKAAAALLFSCNGRGRGLYGQPDGDITPLQEALGGGVPAAGCFCAGEIGPVGKRNFVHGHTASIAILRAT
jgi:small ligand-binding sensory domain FIST